MAQVRSPIHHPHFYDAATPSNVPSGVYAGVYVNGYVWDQGDIDRMARVFRISVDRNPAWARWARCLDIENGAALPADFVEFSRVRRSHWGNDVTAYVNRSNWSLVYDIVKQAGEPQPRYWVATLDGTREVVGPEGTRPWAVQFFGGGAYDLSILYGKNDLHNPRA